MKIALVVQRYGKEVMGGSELHCRMVAERLVAAGHDCTVYTTTAKDYITWRNEYQPGRTVFNGVVIRRFAVEREREIESFNKYSDWIFFNPHTRRDELDWLDRQGPVCPGLVDALAREEKEHDLVIFFTYLYYNTYWGLQAVRGPRALVPTAHDEPAIHLDLYKEVFSLPAAIAYNTDAERAFLTSHFDIRAVTQETVGCGVDLPQHHAYPRDQRPGVGAQPAPETGDDPASDEGGDDDTVPHRARLTERGAIFRRRHRIHGPFVLYGGRIDKGKGCEELIEYFGTYVQDGGDASLVLMGVKLMPLPDEPFINFAGMLSERERVQALEAATVVAVPSPYESLSLLALESFAVGTPILANARSEVLVDHCVRSNAGLYYADRDEFVEGLKLLLIDARLRAAMGRNGRDYVRRNYRWDVILAKYERMIGKAKGGR